MNHPHDGGDPVLNAIGAGLLIIFVVALIVGICA